MTSEELIPQLKTLAQQWASDEETFRHTGERLRRLLDKVTSEWTPREKTPQRHFSWTEEQKQRLAPGTTVMAQLVTTGADNCPCEHPERVLVYWRDVLADKSQVSRLDLAGTPFGDRFFLALEKLDPDSIILPAPTTQYSLSFKWTAEDKKKLVPGATILYRPLHGAGRNLTIASLHEGGFSDGVVRDIYNTYWDLRGCDPASIKPPPSSLTSKTVNSIGGSQALADAIKSFEKRLDRALRITARRCSLYGVAEVLDQVRENLALPDDLVLAEEEKEEESA